MTTGRPLDEHGEPTSGPALSLDPDGEAAALFRESDRALVSDPAERTWATLLERPGDDSGRPELLQWLAPDAAEPPGHVHPTTETFTCVEGRLTVVVDGEATRLAPGETTTVPAGREHTFRNETSEVVAFRAELPSMLTVRGLYTTWGASHEAVADGGSGGPGAVRALLLAEDLADETRMTVAPLAVQRGLWATAGRLARALGHEGIEDRYLDDAFWERRVEQPSL